MIETADFTFLHAMIVTLVVFVFIIILSFLVELIRAIFDWMNDNLPEWVVSFVIWVVVFFIISTLLFVFMRCGSV